MHISISYTLSDYYILQHYYNNPTHLNEANCPNFPLYRFNLDVSNEALVLYGSPRCVWVRVCVCADVEVGWQRVKWSRLSAIKIRQTSQVLKTVDSSDCLPMCTVRVFWQMRSQRILTASVQTFIHCTQNWWDYQKSCKAIGESSHLTESVRFMNEVSRKSIIVFNIRCGGSEADRSWSCRWLAEELQW